MGIKSHCKRYIGIYLESMGYNILIILLWYIVRDRIRVVYVYHNILIYSESKLLDIVLLVINLHRGGIVNYFSCVIVGSQFIQQKVNSTLWIQHYCIGLGILDITCDYKLKKKVIASQSRSDCS